MKITINNQEFAVTADQTILQAARANGVYIPTLCYLSKVSPIGSCRLCVVEVEGSDGFVLSCQTPVKDGIKVTTNSPKLFKERQNIMALYDVNHPLECGVCDKSGECELQNKTSEFKVANQSFAAKEHRKPVENWGFIEYNESLCIMCERCVRVCNEVIGDNRLKVQAGGYKSRIVLNGKIEDDCVECGECMAVCPVGALVSTGFKYSSNAWELNRVPSTCTQCAGGCELFYETKQAGIDTNGAKKIYRITNDVETNTLCGSGRFGFGYESEGVEADIDALAKKLKDTKTVAISGLISNEEALLLQMLSRKLGFSLVSKEIRAYQRFLQNYSITAGEILYNATVDDVALSDTVLLVGAPVVDEMPTIRSALIKASLNLGAQIVDLSVVEDSRLNRVVTQNIRYEAGSEEGVLALLVKTLCANNSTIASWINDLDVGYLSAETNVGEEELARLAKSVARGTKTTIVAGSDLFDHPRSVQIAKLLGVLKSSGFGVLITPPSTNALGVSLICDLADDYQNAVLLDDLGFAPLLMQSGTITTINKEIKPINPAFAWKGATLGAVANKLGFDLEWITDLTCELPEEKGYLGVSFDDLNFGSKAFGYKLQNQTIAPDFALENVANIGGFNGTVVRYINPSSRINSTVATSPNLKRDGELIGSAQFAIAAKIKDGDMVTVSVKGGNIERRFILDANLKGVVARLESFDLPLEILQAKNYRYEIARIAIKEGK